MYSFDYLPSEVSFRNLPVTSPWQPECHSHSEHSFPLGRLSLRLQIALPVPDSEPAAAAADPDSDSDRDCPCCGHSGWQCLGLGAAAAWSGSLAATRNRLQHDDH